MEIEDHPSVRADSPQEGEPRSAQAGVAGCRMTVETLKNTPVSCDC